MKAKIMLLLPLLMLFAACNDEPVEAIPAAALSAEQTAQCQAIFSRDNALLKDYMVDNAVVIGSTAQLQAICPEGVSAPEIDFSKQCLVFAPIDLASVNDEVIGTALEHSKKDGVYCLVVDIQKCTECYTAIERAYAYGVFAVVPRKVEQTTVRTVIR